MSGQGVGAVFECPFEDIRAVAIERGGGKLSDEDRVRAGPAVGRDDRSDLAVEPVVVIPGLEVDARPVVGPTHNRIAQGSTVAGEGRGKMEIVPKINLSGVFPNDVRVVQV